VQAKSFAPAAFDASIRGHGGHGFSDEFSRFAAATAEWRSRNSGFPEGSLYPDVARIGSLQVDGAVGTIKLDHTAFGLADVTGTSSRRLKVAAVTPRGVATAIAVVGRIGDPVGGTQTTQLSVLPRGGSGSVVLDNPAQFSRVTAVLVNADATKTGYDRQAMDWRWSHDAVPFTAVASTDFTPPRVVRISPRAGASGVSRRPRIKVTFDEPVIGVTTRTLKLVGPNGRTVPARLSFRPGARVATLTPRQPLRPHTTYSLRIGGGITDLALNPLQATRQRAFKTGG
jgi:hypothetical protein